MLNNIAPLILCLRQYSSINDQAFSFDFTWRTNLKSVYRKLQKEILQQEVSRSDTFDKANLLHMGNSYNPSYPNDEFF